MISATNNAVFPGFFPITSKLRIGIPNTLRCFYKTEAKLGSEFDSYPLWVAHYYEHKQPRIPRGWIFWQHNDQGNVNGIISRVDFNVFSGDSLEFRNLLIR